MSEYSADNIIVLSFRESIRKRPGMYIGSVDSKGFSVLFDGILSELLATIRTPDHLMTVELEKDGKILISGKFKTNASKLEEALDSTEFPMYSDSGMIHLNLLCHFMQQVELTSNFQDRSSSTLFKDGEVVSRTGQHQERADGFSLRFNLDFSVLPIRPDFDILADSIRRIAMLNPPIEILFRDLRTKWTLQQYFHFPKGVHDLLEKLTNEPNFEGEHLLFHETIGEHTYRIGLYFSFHHWRRKSEMHCFCNDTEVPDPGSLHTGIKSGILKGMRTWLRQHEINPKGLLKTRDLDQNLVITAAVRCPNPILHRSPHYKLVMPEVQKEVSALVADHLLAFFQSDPNIACRIFTQYGCAMLPESCQDALPQSSAPGTFEVEPNYI